MRDTLLKNRDAVDFENSFLPASGGSKQISNHNLNDLVSAHCTSEYKHSFLQEKMNFESQLEDLRQAVEQNNIMRIREIHENNPQVLNDPRSVEVRRSLLWKVTQYNRLEFQDLFINFFRCVNFGAEDHTKEHFYQAIRCGNLQFAEFLLKNGVKLEECGNSLVPNIVCENNNETRKEIIKMLAKYGLHTVQTVRGENIFYIFVNVIVGVVNFMDSQSSFIDKSAPLSWAFLSSKNVSVVEFHRNENRMNQNINFSEVLCGYEDLVEMLISTGADVNSKQGMGGRTALHVACEFHNEFMIKVLISHGANVTAKDIVGNTPFSLLRSLDGNYQNCFQTVIKEITKLIFENSLVVERDIYLIESRLDTQEHLENCLTELNKMANTKFYASHTLYSVLKMSKNIKKLAHLLKNKEFIAKFEENLSLSYYKNDLIQIFEKAIKVRDDLLIVNCKLYTIFGDALPDLIIDKLTEHLNAEDLLAVE